MTEKKSTWNRLTREPLFHFLLLGALVFGVDHLIASGRDNPRVIVIGAEVDNDARALFRKAQGREPTPADIKVMRDLWLDNEVLYREGLALGVDKGDSTIRDRVIFKALNLMQANLVVPPIDDAGLRRWFEHNRARYDEPERVDFLEAVVGDPDPNTAHAFVVALNRGKHGDTEKSGLRIFKGRPRSNVVDSFGSDFADALEALPVGRWQTLPSREGLRVVRLEGRTPAVATPFEAVQSKVLEDWQDAQMQQLRTAAVRELAKQYRIVDSGAAQ